MRESRFTIHHSLLEKGDTNMIKTMRFNGKELVINAELVQFVEETPDTMITLASREKIMVKDSIDDIISKMIDYQRLIRSKTMGERIK